VRFILVGILGVIIGWVVYNLIYFINPMLEYRATTTWVMAYVFGVWQQHGLHRILTFEKTEVSYQKSLRRSYLAYMAGLIISTPINFSLVEIMDLGVQQSWAISVLASTMVNYYLLKNFAFET